MKKRLAKKMLKRQAECTVREHSTPVVQEKTDDIVSESVAEVKAEPKIVETKKDSCESRSTKKINIFYQFSNRQIEQQDIIARIKSQWKEQGNMLKDLKDLVIYLKTEENRAYYVINGSVNGFVAVCD